MCGVDASLAIINLVQQDRKSGRGLVVRVLESDSRVVGSIPTLGMVRF